MKLKRTAALAAAAMMGMAANASTSDAIQQKEAEDHLISLDLDARLDWQMVTYEGKSDRSQTGFIGKYIALKAHGELTDGLTYTGIRQISLTSTINPESGTSAQASRWCSSADMNTTELRST